MWQLQPNGELDKRVYINSNGSKCTTSMVYKDKEENQWYFFDDLMALPYTRKFAAMKISSLYSLGLSKDDLTGHIGRLKTISKSNDAEKYEKIYAETLDFENKVNNATDAIKQLSALTCVYFTINDEEIDSFENNLQIKKMALLEADPEMHNFFLTKQIDASEHYQRLLTFLSQTASSGSQENGDHLD